MAEMIGRLSTADVVFVGESHTDEMTHELENMIQTQIAAACGNKLAVGFEMFPRDQQEFLDRYMSGKTTEKEFRAETKLWWNYQTGYRRLIEHAKQNGLPVVAANMPDSVKSKAYRGKKGLDTLSEEERRHFPKTLMPNSEAYWQRFRRSVRGHMASMTNMSPEQRLYSIQSLWDNTMAFSCVQAREKYPDRKLLHFNGAFHSAYRDGLALQYIKRRPLDTVLTVDIATRSALASVASDQTVPRADYRIFVAARARGPESRMYAVNVSTELKYHLSVPSEFDPSRTYPLVIVVPADGVPAVDALENWRLTLGPSVFIAAVNHLYPQIEPELYKGGRWYWNEDFMHDLSVASRGLPQIHRYITTHFPVDKSKVAVVASGAGATVMTAVALYDANINAELFCISPANYKELGKLGLPEPLKPGGAKAGIRNVSLFTSNKEWWKKEAGEYARSGLNLTVHPDVGALDAVTDSVKKVLGIEDVTKALTTKQYFLSTAQSRLGKLWEQRFILSLRKNGVRGVLVQRNAKNELVNPPSGKVELRPLTFEGQTPVITNRPEGIKLLPGFTAEQLREGTILPMAPGSFGGTTVLVVSEETAATAHDSWRKLESDNAIRKRSRFSSLKLAIEGTARDLNAVLQEIVSEKKSNVLILPALFDADTEAMLKLKKKTRPFENQLNLHWKIGLGGNLYQAVQEKEAGEGQ